MKANKVLGLVSALLLLMLIPHKSDSQTVGQLTRNGKELLKQKRYSEAYEKFSKALVMPEDDINIYLGRILDEYVKDTFDVGGLEALRWCAYMRLLGIGTQKDITKATNFFLIMSKMNDYEAIYMLLVMSNGGFGQPKAYQASRYLSQEQSVYFAYILNNDLGLIDKLQKETSDKIFQRLKLLGMSDKEILNQVKK